MERELTLDLALDALRAARKEIEDLRTYIAMQGNADHYDEWTELGLADAYEPSGDDCDWIYADRINFDSMRDRTKEKRPHYFICEPDDGTDEIKRWIEQMIEDGRIETTEDDKIGQIIR